MNATLSFSGISPIPISGSQQANPQNVTMGTMISDLLVTIIAPVGLAGNAVVLWLLGFHMWRTAISVYIVNLAGADFLFLSCHFIYSLNTFIHYFHSIPISILSFFITVLFFAYIAGLSFLSAISTERCLTVLWPIWYRCHRPRHTSAVMCALLWALSLLLSILGGKYCGFLFSGGHHVWCQVLDLITAVWLIFLCVLLSVSSLALVTRLLCGSQRVQPTRLYFTILLTVLLFLLCGLPSGIYWFLKSWIKLHLNVVYDPLFLVAVVISCVNSCANPIIYFLVGSFRQRWRKRRQTLKLVLQRALQDTPERDEHGGRPPQKTLEMSGRIPAF